MFDNHDQIVIVSMIIGAIPAFLIGYAKGHEHGKIAGRILGAKAVRAGMSKQVGR